MAAAPKLTVRHMSEADAIRLANNGDRRAVYVVVDVAARTMYPHVPQHDRDYGPGRGILFGEEDYLYVPPIMDFIFNTAPAGADFEGGRRANGAAGVNAVLDEIAPDVAQMLEAMATGPGGAPDWSVVSRQIAEELKHRLDRWPYYNTKFDFPHEPGPIIDAEELFTTHPELVRPEWAEMDSEELDSAAKRVLLDSMHIQDGVTREEHHRRTRTVGVRSWMYAYRQGDPGDGPRAVDAPAWPGIVAHSIAVRDDSTDAELEQVGKMATAAAEAEGVKLIAVGKYTTKLREARRQEVRDQLKAEGQRVAELESQLKPAKLRRRALITRVLSWDVARDTDTVVARDAAMSHTAVAAIRAGLLADEEDQAA